MNPFKMILNSMMMGMRCAPFMSFGCGMPPFMPSLFCGCNFMSMPYRQDDNLWFFNSPIYRNTSYDYLLDPNLALRNAQASMQNGGLYGTTWLPGFTFPQIGGLTGAPSLPNLPTNPWSPTQQAQKTPEQIEEEKKKEEEAKKKEEEEAKPAHQKAQNLYNVLGQVKILAEVKKNHFPVLSEEFLQKADEAMEKETADEQYEAMKELIAKIPADVLRKTVLADDNVRPQLRKAGYNFNLLDKNGKRYSLNNNDIDTNDIAHIDRLEKMHNEVVNTELGTHSRYHEFQLIFGSISETNILEIISSWNSKFNGPNEKGILRFIANNLPTGKAKDFKPTVVLNITNFVEKLVNRADNYEGYTKIKTARDDVQTQFNALATNGFDKAGIYKLADACDKLYARLRMQEALEINHYINNNKTFSDLKEITENVIDDKIVIEETLEDLKAENITAPSIEDLDVVEEPEEITIGSENVNVPADNGAENDADADEQYKENKQALVDEYLVGEKQYLTKVSEDGNVYKTNTITSEKYSTFKNGKFTEEKNKADKSDFERYFIVKDNKLIEVTKKADGTFEEPTDAKEVTAVEIGKQDAAVKKAQKLIDENKIVEYKIPGFNKFPLFKATGANQFFAIIDGEFGKIKPTREFSKEFAEKMTVENFDTSFEDNNIKSAQKVKEEKERAENKDVTDVESLNFTSLEYAKSQDGTYEIEKAIMGKEPANQAKCIVHPLSINGYFLITKPKKRYYKYDDANNKLVYQKGVVNISNDGYMKIEVEKNGKKEYEFKECAESITDDLSDSYQAIQDYAKEYTKSICNSDSPMAASKTCKMLNTIIAMNDAMDNENFDKDIIINFIKAYQDNSGFFHDDFCEEIVRENCITEGKDIKSINSKKRYIAKIASIMIRVFNKTSFDPNKVSQKEINEIYEKLEKISKGELITLTYCTDSFGGESSSVTSLLQTAIELDKIIKNIMDAQPKEEEKTTTES